MENTLIKERICNLLESIVEKTESINKSSSQDYLIDVDLAIEDLKHLYREFALLKKVTEEQLESEAGQKAKAQLSSTDPAYRTFPRTFVTPAPGDNQEAEEDYASETDEQGEDQATGEQKEDVVKVVSPGEQKPEQPAGKTEPEPETEAETEAEAEAEAEAETEAESEAETEAETETESEKTHQIDDESNDEKYSGKDVNQKNEHKEDIVEETQEAKEVKEQEKPPQDKSAKKNESIADSVGKNQNKSLGDKYVKGEDTSLNVRLAKMKEDVTIGTKMQHKPIKNLRESIGVNEKFLFINELFEGDIDVYNEAINKLNSFSSIDEAFEFINQLNRNYSWDEHHSSETIDKFAYLVQRRYMTN